MKKKKFLYFFRTLDLRDKQGHEGFYQLEKLLVFVAEDGLSIRFSVIEQIDYSFSMVPDKQDRVLVTCWQPGANLYKVSSEEQLKELMARSNAIPVSRPKYNSYRQQATRHVKFNNIDRQINYLVAILWIIAIIYALASAWPISPCPG